MPKNTAEYQYVTGQYRPSFTALFEQYQLANDQVLRERTWYLDLRYGLHPRQTLDLCFAKGTAKANLVYLHAGYWQSRDKAQFRFIASALSARGFNVALLNYPLCPDVAVDQIVASVSHGLLFSLTKLPARDRRLPLMLAGHSAGAHLAVELAMAQTALAPQQRPISAIVPISGIYDLAPLIETSLNDKLRLDMRQAQACSPLTRVSGALVPAAFVVGGEETPAFLEQSRSMMEAWALTGSPATCLEVAGRDHFTVLQEFEGAGGMLLELIDNLYQAACPAG
ncbi:TPA: alpha/beta hydrolase [Pseudomonas putida]|uniref:Alpha/beta hydrolase n=1 Tax=Pseudomonas putida TaxID=303 RepID=A0ABD7B9K2_PSEPU|nr:MULTISPECIES: alpha/beta hydrolase [Pseudomonas]MBA1318894.1 alpha/beta hydrolase [Pseudomonas monteilii]MCE1020773.1 alpha/beta hydrolase [Pseudomonas monteilii]MCE1038257.1 alpha/beta hydrolase [Pseudomonas monteilii]MCE1089867.1 alpha/beta hydrolase [Pseudomonas monteilii]MDH0023509.1 alpha/beta hydrolase [Pseudomonas monteilii]